MNPAKEDFVNAPQGESSTFENNTIVLIHEGGSSLPLDAISIKILGNGNAYKGIANGNGNKDYRKHRNFYQNLSPIGKSSRYESQNKEVVKIIFGALERN